MINNVPAAAMIFNAHVINLRVYNAGQNVLRQQAALHFAPPPRLLPRLINKRRRLPPTNSSVGVGVAADASDAGGAVVGEQGLNFASKEVFLVLLVSCIAKVKAFFKK